MIGLAVLAAVAAAVDARSPTTAAPAPIGRAYLLTEVTVYADGTSQVTSSQVIRTSDEALALARRLLAEEAGSQGGTDTARPAAGQAGGYAGQCTATAVSSGARCRKRAVTGSRTCELHVGRE